MRARTVTQRDPGPRMSPRRLLNVKRYLASSFFVVTASGLTIAVKPLFDGKTPLIFFTVAVILSAAYGGIGAGLVATALSLAIALALPDHVLVLVMAHSSLTLFALLSVAATVVIGKLRGLNAALLQARNDLQEANDKLSRANQKLSRHTDALSHANEELQQFAYAIAHDLRNPLRNVGALTEVLISNNTATLDAESRECAGMIVSGVQRMESLITSLLDYAEAASRDEDQAVTDCNTVVKLVLEDLHHAIETSGALVTVAPLPAVAMSEHHLIRVFVNLIGNALKYRSAQQPIIHIAVHDQGADWLVTVRDNGIGFDMQHAEEIFGMFKRLHHADRYEGNGVGLALCKVVIEQYGGKIWVESEPDKGSAFLFTLPKIQEPNEIPCTHDTMEQPLRPTAATA